ncbi:hypothetical protein PV779_52880, partial [Streptomyces sp. ID01-9D]|nr:hypothetical protein [Streptomyces sp. ID01-9D]
VVGLGEALGLGLALPSALVPGVGVPEALVADAVGASGVRSSAPSEQPASPVTSAAAAMAAATGPRGRLRVFAVPAMFRPCFPCASCVSWAPRGNDHVRAVRAHPIRRGGGPRWAVRVSRRRR